jgi:TRAP transporter TAXI family solute receptor
MRRIAMTALMTLYIGMFSTGPLNAATERPWATIGAGALTGIYYNCGQAIAKTLDRYPPEPPIKMTVQETQGSLANLDAVTTGRFYFGIIQSDIQYKAWHGVNRSPWAGNPQENLRAVCSLYTEAVNLVASRRPNIIEAKDLTRGRRRINLGEQGSGQYINALEVLDAVGIDPQRDLIAVHTSPVRSLALFQRREIDAFFFTAGHPAAQFREVAAGGRLAHFIPLEATDDELAIYPYYQRATIPIKYYPGMDNDADVPTVGMRATVVASALTPDWMAYGIVKAIVENMDYFKTQLLVFEDLDGAAMLDGLTAPIHPGALKYYQEAGLMP